MTRDNIDDTFMKRCWRRAGLGEFDRQEFERQRGIANWMRRNREAMIDRDEAERLQAQKEQQAHTR